MKPYIIISLSFWLLGAIFIGYTASAYAGSKYPVSSKLASGTVAAISGKGELVAASSETNSYLGVVVSSDSEEAAVATTGKAMTYVSDVDGGIKKGDRLALSALAGVATKLSGGRQQIGIAGDSPVNWQMNDSSDGRVRVALIPVDLSSTSGSSGSVTSSGIENTMQQLANRLTGKTVAFWRIVAAFVIGLIGILLAFSLVFISTRGSFVALGRNPMASPIIIRSMWRSIGVGVIVSVLSIVLAYLIIWLGA